MKSTRLYHQANFAGLMALICLIASIGAMTASFLMLPTQPFLAWPSLMLGLLGMALTICLTFEAVHYARNGYAASREEWEVKL